MHLFFYTFKVISFDPGNGIANANIGYILKATQKYQEAIPYLETGIQSGDDETNQAKFYVFLGEAYTKSDRNDDVSFQVHLHLMVRSKQQNFGHTICCTDFGYIHFLRIGAAKFCALASRNNFYFRGHKILSKNNRPYRVEVNL